MILFSKPAPMKKAYIATTKENVEQVATLLQEAGVVHIHVVEQEKIVEEYEAYLKLREEIMSILSRVKGLRVEAELTVMEVSQLTIDKVKSDVSSIASKVHIIESRINDLKEKHDNLLQLVKILEKLPGDVNPRDLYYKGKRVSSILLVCKQDQVELVKSLPYVLSHSLYSLGEDLVAILLYLDTSAWDKLLDYAKSHNIFVIPEYISEYIHSSRSINELRMNILSESSRLEREIERLERELEDLIKGSAQLLGKYLLYIDNQLQKYHSLDAFRKLKHVTVLTGWIPEASVNSLVEKINSSNLVVYFEFRDPEPNDEPPTLFSNPGPLRFYQLITKLWGVPKYFEKDPTPIVAYSFTLFFGLMNADLGYGLAAVLATLFILDKLTDNPESPAFKELKGVLLVSNTVALILGALSGSVFGDLLQRLFGLELPVLLAFLSNPLTFIVASIIIGLVHVNIAHALTTIKLLRERKIYDLLIELGLFVMEIFGIPYVLLKFFRYQLPLLGALPTNVLLAGSIAGIVMIIIGSLITMRSIGVITWIFQITGLVGDVLSYARIAGVGMASVYMAQIFNFILSSIINALRPVNPVLPYLIVLPLAIVVHAMTLALSVLGAFVHSMRLCLVEFLSKFYEGGGYEYNPLRIINKTVITIK